MLIKRRAGSVRVICNANIRTRITYSGLALHELSQVVVVCYSDLAMVTKAVANAVAVATKRVLFDANVQTDGRRQHVAAALLAPNDAARLACEQKSAKVGAGRA